jgi:DNA-binding protein YbaB
VAEVEAFLAEHLEPARRKLERRRTLIEQMQTGEIGVWSRDRKVKITQTCAGEVKAIEISPGTFEEYDERSFAALLTKTLQAGREIGRQAAERLTDEVLQEKESRAHVR